MSDYTEELRMAKSNRYDDKAEELMRYITVRQQNDGEKVKIENAQGLKQYLTELNKKDATKKGKHRMSRAYIDRVASSQYAQTHLPKIFGRFSSNFTVEKSYGLPSERPAPEAEKQELIIQKNKAAGRQTYRYPGGLAVRARMAIKSSKSGEKRYQYLFRDATTGKLVSKKDITE